MESRHSSNGVEQPIKLSTSFVNVPHRLGRAVRGWIVIDQTTASRVFRDPLPSSAATNPDPTLFLRLQSSATTTVKLWVF